MRLRFPANAAIVIGCVLVTGFLFRLQQAEDWPHHGHVPWLGFALVIDVPAVLLLIPAQKRRWPRRGALISVLALFLILGSLLGSSQGGGGTTRNVYPATRWNDTQCLPQPNGSCVPYTINPAVNPLSEMPVGTGF
jgi:hypothetical protein